MWHTNLPSYKKKKKKLFFFKWPFPRSDFISNLHIIWPLWSFISSSKRRTKPCWMIWEVDKRTSSCSRQCMSSPWQPLSASSTDFENHNFNITKKDHWNQNGYTGLNNEMQISDDDQPGRERRRKAEGGGGRRRGKKTLKQFSLKEWIKSLRINSLLQYYSEYN